MQELSKSRVLPNPRDLQPPELRGPFPEALPAAPPKFVPGPEWKNSRAFAGWGLNRQKPTDTAGGGEKLSPQLQELLTALWRYLQ